MSPEQKNGTAYHLTYKITGHDLPISREEVPENHGACTSLLTVAVLDDGDSHEYLVQGIDGPNKNTMNALQVFQVWLMVAKKLTRELPPESGPGALVSEVVSIMDRAKEAS